MSTAVVYASRYGSTGAIARRIATGLGPDTAVFDLADGDPDLSGYDLVVLGTAVYKQEPLGLMKRFTSLDALDGTPVALFVGGMETDPDKRDVLTKGAFPAQLMDRAVAVGFLGGRLLFSQMVFTDKVALKRLTKTQTKTDVDAIDRDAIDRFVSELRDSLSLHAADPQVSTATP
ncbi:MAG: flavodoxin domain-containing protein [Micrococcales bacterium]|nr:flavodoxin domain-containing protein [Micrococcales bacterium]MCL2667979.1 flavodoxin domain-containing protein [Micrococcales bacterium]